MDDDPRILVVTVIIAACWLWLGRRLVDLGRRPHDAALQTVCLILAGLAVTMTAQFTAPWLDTVSGRSDVGRFIGNAAAMVAVCGVRLFLVQAGGGPAALPTAARRHLAVLAVAVGAAAVLFVLTPVEPNTSLGVRSQPTHVVYASPYVYVYLGYTAILLATTITASWRYARAAGRRALRYALRCFAAAGACGLVYCVAKGAFLAATHLGAEVGQWEYRVVSPLYLLTVALGLTGLAIPAIGARIGWIRKYRSYRRLLPLWQALCELNPGIALHPPTTRMGRLRRLRHLDFHLYRLVIEIRDGQLALRPRITAEAHDVARLLTGSAGFASTARAATEAATIAVALHGCGDRPAGESAPEDGADPPANDPGRLDAEIEHLKQVARLLPIAQAALANRPTAGAARVNRPAHQRRE